MADALNLELRGIRKAYPGVVAVDGVDLDVAAGEIHALVGENGAGKSTLASIAFGSVKPDAGTVLAAGTVGLVHQHFELAGRLRVWQNVVLGREPRAGIFLDESAAKERVRRLARANGLHVDLDAFVEDLPVAVRQRVELLRELDRNPAVLLLDEPTAALAPVEIASFFATIEGLAERGTAVLIVTHKLQEVLNHARRVSVMRAGRIVARMATHETSHSAIARAMVGGELPAIAERSLTARPVVFAARDLTTGERPSAVRGATFDVRAGEIVGIAGVEGNGQSALADAIAGVIPHRGTVVIDGAVLRDFKARSAAGMRIIPQDRQREGLVLPWSIDDNMSLGRQRETAWRRGLLVDRAAQRSASAQIVERFDVRCPSPAVAVETLSGGNQQKIVVGRALYGSPRFVLAYQPTRGIDIGAAALVASRLIEARNAGVAILLISFDLDEILTLADRVVVMFGGELTGSFERASLDRATIGELMAGAGFTSGA